MYKMFSKLASGKSTQTTSKTISLCQVLFLLRIAATRCYLSASCPALWRGCDLDHTLLRFQRLGVLNGRDLTAGDEWGPFVMTPAQGQWNSKLRDATGQGHWNFKLQDATGYDSAISSFHSELTANCFSD